MSGLIGAALPQNIVEGGDLRLAPPQMRRIGAIFEECVSAIAPAPFTSEWWPSVAGFLGDLGADVGILAAESWGEYYPAGGAASRFGFVGVTRDQYGSIMGNCVVKLFRTSDDLLIDQTTSDPTTGAFLLNTAYYPTTHYIVAYKAGSPDVAGASVNTLIGT